MRVKNDFLTKYMFLLNCYIATWSTSLQRRCLVSFPLRPLLPSTLSLCDGLTLLVCKFVFALSAGPSLAATAESPLSVGKWPDSVTASDWTSCFFLFLSSYLLRHTVCLLLCEKGSDRAHGGAALDTKVDIHTCWQIVVSVWHKHCPVDCGNIKDTYPLCCFCGGTLTVEVTGCSVWEAAGRTQLHKQWKWNGMGPGLSCLAQPWPGLLA